MTLVVLVRRPISSQSILAEGAGGRNEAVFPRFREAKTRFSCLSKRPFDRNASLDRICQIRKKGRRPMKSFDQDQIKKRAGKKKNLILRLGSIPSLLSFPPSSFQRDRINTKDVDHLTRYQGCRRFQQCGSSSSRRESGSFFRRWISSRGESTKILPPRAR